MTTVFFSMISDLYWNKERAYYFVNSFKRFHPDIDLVIFRQDAMDYFIDFKADRPYVIDKQTGRHKFSLFVAKAAFARMLMGKYEKVVNMDADTIITGRLDEVLKDDWEVGGAWNYNDFEHASLENITPEMYVQCGLIGSTRPEFWDIWYQQNYEAYMYKRLENDTLNLILYNDPIVKRMKLKIFDKEKEYYGCKSLGLESQMYLEGDKLMLKGEQVKAYHQARANKFPKMQFDKLGFKPDVAKWLNKLGSYGVSVKIQDI